MIEGFIQHPDMGKFIERFEGISGIQEIDRVNYSPQTVYVTLMNCLDPNFRALDSHTEEYAVKTAAGALVTITHLEQPMQIGSVAYALEMADVKPADGVTSLVGKEIGVGMITNVRMFRLPRLVAAYLLTEISGRVSAEEFSEMTGPLSASYLIGRWKFDTANNLTPFADWLVNSAF